MNKASSILPCFAAYTLSAFVCHRPELDDMDETTLVSVPPLDLDFSVTDDVTSRSAITPKPNSSKSKSGKKVRYDEESLRSTARSKSAPPGGSNGKDNGVGSRRSQTPSPGPNGKRDKEKNKKYSKK